MASFSTTDQSSEPGAFSGPVRTCIGCRKRATVSELLRVVVQADDRGQAFVVPDPRRRAAGRGAHLHPTITCLELAVRRRSFARALRAPGASDSTAVAQFIAQLLTHHEEINRPETGAGSS